MSDIRETKEVTHHKSVIIGHKCDACGKIAEGETLPDDWYNFDSHHTGWGNDSGDSYDYFDVCGPNCFFVAIGAALKELADYKRSGAEIAGMPYEFAEKLFRELTLSPKPAQ